jgi:oligoendopeptidase F
MLIQASQEQRHFMQLPWPEIEPRYQELSERPLGTENVIDWLRDWSLLSAQVSESLTRLMIATSLDTADAQAERRYRAFLDQVHQPAQAAEQKLKQKLLDSGLQAPGMQLPLRKMRAEAALFREANLPLLSQDRKLGLEYNKIIGAQTIEWQGQERTLQQIRPLFYQPERAQREHAWRLAMARQLADRQAINQLYARQLTLRRQIAANAGLPDYRAYRWQQMLRLDYTPADCETFQQAIEQVAVQAASRVYENYRRRLGVDTLRPWDLDLDLYTIELPPLPSYGDGAALEARGAAIFQRVDPALGQYFATLRQEGLLDLDNRAGKAPGAYCASLPAARRPFIFANFVGLFSDVRTLLHESGHAFHNFEVLQLPFIQQRHPGLEFSEVASMSMELLAAPYLAASQGGFYSDADADRGRLAHLERILLFWPYMAVVDAFQHWVYTHIDEALDPSACDATWLALWRRYLPGVDWSGLDDAAMTGWQRKQHIHRSPFYYVEYGVAQMGAVQVWRNALQNQPAAVAHYRQALALGGTASLPELYAAAGGKFAFDAATLKAAVELVEQHIAALLPA